MRLSICMEDNDQSCVLDQFARNFLQVPFFSDDEEAPTTPKADTLFIPRENPRALVIRPLEQWPGRTNGDKRSLSKEHTPVQKSGNLFFTLHLV